MWKRLDSPLFFWIHLSSFGFSSLLNYLLFFCLLLFYFIFSSFFLFILLALLLFLSFYFYYSFFFSFYFFFCFSKWYFCLSKVCLEMETLQVVLFRKRFNMKCQFTNYQNHSTRASLLLKAFHLLSNISKCCEWESQPSIFFLIRSFKSLFFCFLKWPIIFFVCKSTIR